jgi:hypothetical protein
MKNRKVASPLSGFFHSETGSIMQTLSSEKSRLLLDLFKFQGDMKNVDSEIRRVYAGWVFPAPSQTGCQNEQTRSGGA